MKKKVWIICLLALVMLLFVSCGNRNNVEIDPDANMIGTIAQASDNVDMDVIALIETTGSDYNTPDKGYTFYVVKFKFINNGNDAVELREADFFTTVDDVKFTPIEGKLNFVPDKMGESLILDGGVTVTTKAVFMLPTKGSTFVLTYQPNFSDNIIKYNLVDQ